MTKHTCTLSYFKYYKRHPTCAQNPQIRVRLAARQVASKPMICTSTCNGFKRGQHYTSMASRLRQAPIRRNGCKSLPSSRTWVQSLGCPIILSSVIPHIASAINQTQNTSIIHYSCPCRSNDLERWGLHETPNMRSTLHTFLPGWSRHSSGVGSLPASNSLTSPSKSEGSNPGP